jgi:hypothetical protein
MNQRMMIQLEVIKNERTYSLSIPMGAPYEDAHAVAQEFAIAIKDSMEKSKEAAAQTESTTEKAS